MRPTLALIVLAALLCGDGGCGSDDIKFPGSFARPTDTPAADATKTPTPGASTVTPTPLL